MGAAPVRQSQTLWRDGVLFASGTQAANNFSDVSMLELSSTSFLEGANVNVYVAGWANIAWTDARRLRHSPKTRQCCSGRGGRWWRLQAGRPQIVTIIQASGPTALKQIAARGR